MDGRKKLVMGAAAGGISLPLLQMAHSGGVGLAVAGAIGFGTYLFAEELAALSRGGGKSPEPGVSSLGDGEVQVSKLAVALLGKERAAEAAQRRAARREQQGQEPEIGQAGEPVFPKYADDETLRIGQVVDRETLAKLIAVYQQDPNRRVKVAGCRFEPHINALFGKGMILAAVQGSGKSMLNGLIIEQAGACDAPAIVLDHKGEYPPITELNYLNGLIAGGVLARKKAEQNGVPYFPLTAENADAFVEKVIVGHYQAVVPLPTYGEGWLEKAEIVAAVGQALMRYSGRQRLQEKKVLPCLVFLDEAQLYLPQNVNLLPPEAKKSSDVLDSLQNAYFALVSNGRSNGYTMCFATQSLTYIAKWAIKSSQIRVIMRHVEVNDLDMCEKMISPTVATREEIESLPPGVGVVFGFSPKPMVVQFDTRESRDESETPGIDRLRQPRDVERESRSTAKVADLTLAELVTLLNAQPTNGKAVAVVSDEQDEEKNTEGLREVAPPAAEKRDKRRLASQIDLKIAVALWNAGYNSRRKLAAALDIAPNQAEHLMEAMGVKEEE